VTAKKADKLPFCCRLPFGAQPLLSEGIPLQLNEGFVETYRLEEGHPHFAFLVAVDKTALAPLFDALVAALPSPAYAILELPPEPEDDDGPAPAPGPDESRSDIYISLHFDKSELLAGLAPYKLQLLHDGLVGVGVASGPPGASAALVREVFVDDHQLIHIHDTVAEPWRTLLKDAGLKPVELLHTVDSVPHVHQALDQFSDEEIPEPLRGRPWNELIFEEFLGNLLEALQFEKQGSSDGESDGHAAHAAPETVH